MSISATSVSQRICRNSDRDRKRAGPGTCCVKGAAHPWLRGSWTLSCVGEFDDLGEVSAQLPSGWFYLWPEKARLAARSVAPGKGGRLGRSTPDGATGSQPAGGERDAAFLGFHFRCLVLQSLTLCTFHLLSVFN